MQRVSDYFSPQAKAIVSALMVLLAQVIAFVGTGGWSVLVSLTLGNWLGIAMATLLAWGFTYNIPNAQAAPPAPPVIAQGIEISNAAQDQLDAIKSQLDAEIARRNGLVI